MADEITVNNMLIARKGLSSISKVPGQYTIDWNGNQYIDRSQVIGTAAELVEIPSEITTAGVGAFLNLDDTNYIEIGVVVSATFYPVIKILTGEIWVFRLAITATLYARAHTAAAKLGFTVLED